MEEHAAVDARVAAEQRPEEDHLADVASRGIVGIDAAEEQGLVLVVLVAALQRQLRHPLNQALEHLVNGLRLAAVDQDLEAVVLQKPVEVDHLGGDGVALAKFFSLRITS